jgi:hypothetical protein
MQTYEHRQSSPLALVAVAPSAAAFARYARRSAWRPAHLAAVVATAALTLPFTTLRTRVDEGGIAWAFGLGFPGGSIPFADIQAVQITKTRFWEGFGIHWTMRHGWLWNVAGSDAVMIHKRNGKIVTLGTDDAQGLYDAIRSRLSS